MYPVGWMLLDLIGRRNVDQVHWIDSLAVAVTGHTMRIFNVCQIRSVREWTLQFNSTLKQYSYMFACPYLVFVQGLYGAIFLGDI